jgi:hypothetical protein
MKQSAKIMASGVSIENNGENQLMSMAAWHRNINICYENIILMAAKRHLCRVMAISV